ncbi:MAG: N-acetyl-gamma-glutamyl-phosphate reductase, partial [Proteobacteria bacterium]|nr:N-acetyl-gamma-glutamyl-phosphate reductase [Pseudomonadota bacterium]
EMMVIDLGGDFRLKDTSLYERYYGRPHPVPELLQRAVYGLSEWNRKAVSEAALVANPGCYPTSVLLPVLPLLKEGIIDGEGISISSMSGVSGAGRSATVELSFAEVNETVRAYKVGVHQHEPEMQTYCRAFGGIETKVNFVAHLLPINRGIYSTMFAHLKENKDLSTIASTFDRYYGKEPFIRILESRPPEIAHVRGNTRIDIGFTVDENSREVIILSAIDNLVKGAAGQAIQNFNIRYGFNETEGLA